MKLIRPSRTLVCVSMRPSRRLFLYLLTALACINIAFLALPNLCRAGSGETRQYESIISANISAVGVSAEANQADTGARLSVVDKQFVELGLPGYVYATFEAPAMDIGSFDFYVEYDTDHLALLHVNPGVMFQDNEWDFFHWEQTSPGLIHIQGIADTGAYAPPVNPVAQFAVCADISFAFCGSALPSTQAFDSYPVVWSQSFPSEFRSPGGTPVITSGNSTFVDGALVLSSLDSLDGFPVTPFYDDDCDGVRNEDDDCPGIIDGDDYELDGINAGCDNCPFSYNPNQDDLDVDDVGDACDNCPIFPNSDQQDVNSNGIGDACEFAGVTSSGSNVAVPLGSSATVEFQTVATPGTTTLEISGTGPAPDGFYITPTSAPVYFSINSDATYSGDITICLDYSALDIPESAKSGLALMHHNGTTWEDITTLNDPMTSTLCGSASSLSPFVVALTGCCDTPGDSNNDGSFNIADVTYGIARIFSGGPPAPCLDEGDIDGDNSFNIADVTYGIGHIFAGGPAPVCGTTGN